MLCLLMAWRRSLQLHDCYSSMIATAPQSASRSPRRFPSVRGRSPPWLPLLQGREPLFPNSRRGSRHDGYFACQSFGHGFRLNIKLLPRFQPRHQRSSLGHRAFKVPNLWGSIPFCSQQSNGSNILRIFEPSRRVLSPILIYPH